MSKFTTPRLLRPIRLRMLLQAIFTTFCLYAGFRFQSYVAWMTGKTELFIPKPPSVEGFLPISAFMAAKRFFLTGLWDAVHPAGLTLFLAITLMAVLFRKGFCGYICPVGFISGLLERLGRRLGISRNTNRLAEYICSVPKYLILAGFFWFIGLNMNVQAIDSFLTAPYNLVADAKMLAFFTSPSGTSIGVIAFLAIISIVYRNAWCRFLCPYGALLGILSLIGPVRIVRDATTCINCGKCRKACPSGIRVDNRQHMNTPECIGCAACAEVCPVEGCVTPRICGRPIPIWSIAIGSVAVLLGMYVWAVLTGHWHSELPLNMLQRMHMLQLGG